MSGISTAVSRRRKARRLAAGLAWAYLIGIAALLGGRDGQAWATQLAVRACGEGW